MKIKLTTKMKSSRVCHI